MRGVALAVCSFLVAVGLGACAKTIDSEELEGDLVDQFAPEFNVDPDEATGDCPDDIDAEEGAEFECTLSTEGLDDLTVEVTLTDDDGAYEAVVPPEQFERP